MLPTCCWIGRFYDTNMGIFGWPSRFRSRMAHYLERTSPRVHSPTCSIWFWCSWGAEHLETIRLGLPDNDARALQWLPEPAHLKGCFWIFWALSNPFGDILCPIFGIMHQAPAWMPWRRKSIVDLPPSNGSNRSPLCITNITDTIIVIMVVIILMVLDVL